MIGVFPLRGRAGADLAPAWSTEEEAGRPEPPGGPGQPWDLGRRHTEPRHRIAFDPGEVWLGESRLISHQIYYGEAALVYMWFVTVGSMSNPGNRFNARVEQIHQQKRAPAAAA